MSMLSIKKISAAAVAAALSVSAISKASPITTQPPISPYATNTPVYSASFEYPSGDSQGNPYTPGFLVNQGGTATHAWAAYPEGEVTTDATVVAPGLNASGQAVKLQMGNQGATPSSPVYSDYYKQDLTPILQSGMSTNVSWTMNTNLTTSNDFAGIEVFDANQTIASLFVGNVGGDQEVEVYDAGTGNLKPVDTVHGYKDGAAPLGFMHGATDGVSGNYQISIDPTNHSFTVSFGGQTYTTVLGATGTVGDQITGIAFASIDQSGTAASATFDDLSVFQSTPEPASVFMIGIGGLILMAQRPKRHA